MTPKQDPASGGGWPSKQFDLRLVEVDGPEEVEGEHVVLTERQIEAVQVGAEEGWYEVPRGCTGDALSRRLKVSNGSAIRRCRVAAQEGMAALAAELEGVGARRKPPRGVQG